MRKVDRAPKLPMLIPIPLPAHIFPLLLTKIIFAGYIVRPHTRWRRGTTKMEAGQEQASGKYCSCIVLLSLILYLFSF